MGANWQDSGPKSRSGAGDLEVRTGSAGERIVPDLGTQYLRNRAQGWWFPLICAAELKQGREEFEALSAEGDGSGSALDGWPYKYAQDTWFPLICAAETKQDCEVSEALSTGRDCVSSERDGCCSAEECTIFLAVGWSSGWLVNADLT